MTISAHRPGRAFRRALLLGCAAAGFGSMAGQAHAQAFNGTPTTAFGGVLYNRATPTVETVTITTPTAVIDWNVANANFLPAGNVATFQNGPNNTDFVVLNRLSFNGPVRFDGTVLSRLVTPVGGSVTGGTVLFSAPNGIIVGSTGFFDVGSLVLTSLFVNIDAGGNFWDPATRGISLNAGPSPLGGAAVVTEAGARINALQPNSFVAMIGQVVQHGGTTRVNGSAGYVAGEVVQFRANQGLFDIIVSTGSGNAIPLTHSGTTGGPASTGAGDNHAIYLVAMPKNMAITAVLQGDIGFDPAVAVGVENGLIVLSAGANVVGGTVDRYGDGTGTPAADLPASFEIRGGTVRSDLIGIARTSILAQPTGAASITFQQDVSLFAAQNARMVVRPGQTIDVLGNAIVSAAAFDTITGATDLTGGQAAVITQGGGAIHITGTLTVDASAQGLVAAGGVAGSGTGGTAAVNALGGGDITVSGGLTILANGNGANSVAVPIVEGGTGTGGTATLAASLGGTITASDNVFMSANGTASASDGVTTQDGATGQGGTVNVTSGGSSTITIGGPFTGDANGTGGNVPFGTVVGGPGNGGTINVTATDAGLVFNGDATFTAGGTGGIGPTGGNGQGGSLFITAERGTIDFAGQTGGAMSGIGGAASVAGGTGGDGQGGLVSVQARSSDAISRITAGAFTFSAHGQGGGGGAFSINTPGGTGGDGTGGTISILAQSANATITLGAVTLGANGFGGTGGSADNNVDGGNGGTGQGGEVTLGVSAGPQPGGGGAPTGSATFASVDASARGFGGGGGFGTGDGGDGLGGTVSLVAEGAPTIVSGVTLLGANGDAAPGAGSPGGGTGQAGQATGGIVNLSASAHPTTNAPGTLQMAAVTGAANALGNGPGNLAGEWHVGASGGSAVIATDMTLTAAAQGTGIGMPAASTLDPQNGTITVSGTARLSTDGDIRLNAGQAGRIAGGRYELVAGRDVILSHTAPVANGFSADVGNLFIRAARDVTVNNGAATRATDITDIRAMRLATIGGRVVGREIRIGSIDLDLQATGAIGDAATELVILDVDGGDNGPLPGGPAPALGLAANQFTVVGGTTQGPGYTLTNAEAGRIRAGTLRILVPALSAVANRAPDLIIRDLTVNGGGAATGLGILQVITPGIGRVEGNVLMANAGATNGLLLNARDRLEVVTPTASVRVRDAAGAPGGTLQLVSNNIWVATDAIITLLRADPNYAGRDDDLIDNDGNDVPRGYVEGGAVTLTTRGTAYVQNTTAARGTFLSGSDFGGITTGAGGLTIVADAPGTNVYAFGRRLNADGTFQTGDLFFFASTYNTNAGATYTPAAAVNTCIIVTGQCPARIPPDTGVDGKEPFTGPTDGSVAIMLPGNDADDVIDSSFAADPLIEEPVTSGSEPGLWNCDPDHDGDCDDQPR